LSVNEIDELVKHLKEIKKEKQWTLLSITWLKQTLAFAFSSW
jgi:hypothetical protein